MTMSAIRRCRSVPYCLLAFESLFCRIGCCIRIGLRWSFVLGSSVPVFFASIIGNFLSIASIAHTPLIKT
jgi:hypothetical protein